tara:strand:+ start:8412 stop:9536 length:1125 start_codon:yes stop_codon:yes gene_type:complete
MVKIPETGEPTTTGAVDKFLEDEARKSDAPFRGHLGASSIGRECERELWYSFRGATRVEHPGRILRLFGRGHREEPSLVQYLRNIGVVVHDVDPRSGDQFRYSTHGGHFGGSMDGAAKGLVESPRVWCVLEFKTSNDKSFKQLKKNGVEKSKPEHFAQMQVYMGFSGMRRAYYLTVNKNDDSLYSEFVEYKEGVDAEMIEKARRIISSANPPAKLSEDPSWWKCRFCDHSTVCHSTETLPTLTCRTCLHATPETEHGDDSIWSCKLHKVDSLTFSQQVDGCIGHRFIPSVVDFASPVDADEDKNFVEYELRDGGERFRNGDLENGGFSSSDMKRHGSSIIEHRDEIGAALRRAFDARPDGERASMSKFSKEGEE